MGNTRSSTFDESSQDTWWTNGTQYDSNRTVSPLNTEVNISKPHVQVDVEREQRKKELAEDFEAFKRELARKHEKRRQILAEKRQEMANVRDELIAERKKNEELTQLLKKANEKVVCDKCDGSETHINSKEFLTTITNLKEENEDLRNEIDKLLIKLRENAIIAEKNKELRISLAQMQKGLQSLNTEVINFEKERIDYQEHVTALKDVVKVSKEMLAVREKQIGELRKKITSIEEILASKEMNILSDDLRHEYERQLRNIRNLRALYEERQRVDKRERENLQTQIDDLKKNVEEEQQKSRELQEKVDEVEKENSQNYDKIKSLESNLGLSKAECKELQAEMAVINQLFSQILLGFNNDQDIDLDKLIRRLEENHDLLTNIVINEESNEVSALPKVLLDLINQVNENMGHPEMPSIEVHNLDKEQSLEVRRESLATIEEENDSQLSLAHQLNSPEEIVQNLPKVWRVLIELLSHQCAPNNVLTDSVPKTEEIDHPCYKSIQTPTGTRSVLSVSKTFIRLKDLILEKKFLEKEMGRLKQLNTHLEGRLQDQEKRLVLVSDELSKTWHVVGKMQKQHQQLHTQEKILRYELAQKRKLLTELKEELEYCREKWLQARNKNSTTEEQWKQLRNEFASRKTYLNEDYNNSVESGYSDDKSSSDDEEREHDVAVSKALSGNAQVLEDGSETRDANLQPSENIIASEGDDTAPTILDVVQNEIAVIEDTLISDDAATCSSISDTFVESSTNEGTHSFATQKTDLVQNRSDEERQENSVLSANSSRELQEHLVEVSSSNPEALTRLDEEQSIEREDATQKETGVTERADTSINEESGEFSRNHQTSGSIEDANNTDIYVDENRPSTSCGALEQNAPSKTPSECAAEFVARREERMKRLEEQCKQLYSKVATTAIKSIQMSTKLDGLHDHYGEGSQEEGSSSADNGEENASDAELKEAEDEE